MNRGRMDDNLREETLSSSNYNNATKCQSEETVTESFRRLNDIQSSSTERVTRSRLQAEQREAKRRDEETEVNAKKDALVSQADVLNEDVSAGWKECASAANAQDLSDLMKKQNSHCEEAISKLDDIAKQFSGQLRQKDHEYVTALKRNRQEIERLQECIEREHGLLKAAFEEELQLIEESLNADKSKIVQDKKNELDALMAERNNVELAGLANQLKVIEKQRSGIKETEASGDQDKLDLKEKLESELRRLEIELEDTRARRQFESDKLEFDVRVLDELSDNNAEIAKQKKRIMKGKEELNRCIETKHREQERGAKENQILEDDCERIERQCNGLKEKFERFKVSDNDKFRAILALHEDDLQQLQDELDKSRDVIFGGEIGCSSNEDISCISNPSQINDVVSATPIGIGKKVDSFGLLHDDNDVKDRNDDWQQAETLMTDYRVLLEKREGLHTDAKELENQNHALEEELRSRLKDKVNEELAFPPSNAISVGDEVKK